MKIASRNGRRAGVGVGVALSAALAVGVGTAGAAPPEGLVLDPPVVAYGPVVVGETLQRPVRMTNTTSATMSYAGARWPNFGNPSGWDYPYGFWNMSGSGEEFPCYTIQPGDSCTLSFGFTPKNQGAFRTYFEITYMAGGDSYSDMTRMVGVGLPPSG